MTDEAVTQNADTGAAAAATATETAQAPSNVLADGASAAAAAKATDTKAEGDANAETNKAAAGDKGADTKDKAADPDKPIEYTDFTLPEGVEVDQTTLGEAKTLLAGMKLPQEQAQKLVDFYAGKLKASGEAQANNWVKLNEKWVSDFKADKEIGGDRVQETVAAAVRAMDRFGTPGLREALIMTGAGNHPEVIRFVARVGKATAEDRFHVAGGASAGTSSAAEVLYPDQTKGS